MIENYKKLPVNKMAEYLDAKPLRRGQIVRQLKSDLGHPAQYYALAQAAASRVITSSDPVSTRASEREKVELHPGWGLHPKQLIANNLAAFEGLIGCLDSNGILARPVSFRKPSLQLEPRLFGDVRLSNRFDVETVTVGRKQKYGGIKFYLNKEHPLSDFSAAVLAAMLTQAAIEMFGKNAVSPEGIYIIDGFQGKAYSCPSQFKRHLSEGAAAAHEFSLHWDSIDEV